MGVAQSRERPLTARSSTLTLLRSASTSLAIAGKRRRLATALAYYTVYIYPAACTHLSPQCDHLSAFALIYAGFSLRRREVSSRNARRGSSGRRGTPFWWEHGQRRTLLDVGWLRSPRTSRVRVF